MHMCLEKLLNICPKCNRHMNMQIGCEEIICALINVTTKILIRKLSNKIGMLILR
jgi:hypothetical protein